MLSAWRFLAAIHTDIPNVDSNSIFNNAINLIYVAGGITAVVTIIIAGYLYVISGGNPSEVEKAKNAILYSIIGLIIIGAAFTLTNFVIGRF